MLSLFGYDNKVCCGQCPGLPVHEDAAQRGVGAMHVGSGHAMPFVDVEEEVFRYPVDPEMTAENTDDALGYGAHGEAHPQCSSRTPLKEAEVIMDPQAAFAKFDKMEAGNYWEASVQKSLRLTKIACTPKVMCYTVLVVSLVIVCALGILGQGQIPISEWTSTTTTTWTITSTTATTIAPILVRTSAAPTGVASAAACSSDRYREAFHPTKFEPEALQAAETVPTVCLSMVVHGMDYDALATQYKLLAEFETEVSNAVAAAAGAGTLPSQVSLVLAPGPLHNQVVVKATLAATSESDARNRHANLSSSQYELSRSIAARANGLHGVETVRHGNIMVTDVAAVHNRAADVASASPFSLVFNDDTRRYASGMVSGVICVCCLYCLCTVCGRISIRPAEEAGMARHLRRNFNESEEGPDADPPSVDFDDDVECSTPAKSQAWVPVLPGEPGQVKEPEKKAKEPEKTGSASPQMGESNTEKEVKQGPMTGLQAQKAEFEYLKTTRDMGFTESEARAVLLEEDGDYEAAVDKLRQMLEIDPSLAQGNDL